MSARELNPTTAAAVARLRKWAISPTGGGKLFNWGTPGDFAKCQKFYADKMPHHMIDGWCANLHRLATGAMPGHAPAELAIKAGEKGAKKAAGR